MIGITETIAIALQWDAHGKTLKSVGGEQNSWEKPLNMSTTIQGKMYIHYKTQKSWNNIWLFQFFFVPLHQQKELRYGKIKKRNSWFRVGRYIDVG